MRHQKNIAVTIMLTVCLLTSNGIAYGQGKRGATRIRFKRGEASATVNGQLSSRRLRQAFLIGASEGQELYVQIKARSNDGLDFANVIISDPSGKDIATDDGGSVRMRLKQTGNYRIEVSPPGSFYREDVKGYKRLQFSLFVRIN